MTMVDISTVLLTETIDSSGGTFRWMSPELLDPSRSSSNGRPTRESDCYALGMVIYEVGWLCHLRWSFAYPFQVLTGLRPFHHLHGYTPVVAILRDERPEKPLNAQSLGFSAALWGLVQLCWSETDSARPTARQLLDCISPASLTWVLPDAYPAVGIDAPSVTDSYSPSPSRTSLGSWTDEV